MDLDLLAAHRTELARKIELMAKELDYAAEQLRRQVAELVGFDPASRSTVAGIVGDAVATATKAGADAGLHLRGLVDELVQHEHSAAGRT